MAKDTVSIIIVSWRTPDLLAQCLNSLSVEIGYPDFEIFVIDNNSGDQTLEMLRESFPKVKVIANQTNVGFSKACNQAIPLTSAEYVLLLNPDTVVTGNAITKMASFMSEESECGAVGPKILNPNGTLQLASRRSFPSPAAALFRITYLSKLFPKSRFLAKYNMTYVDPEVKTEVDALSGSCMMVRRKAIEQVGLLDEDIFMFGEDIDWCWRMRQHHWHIYYLPQAVIYHVHGAASRLRPIGTTFDLHKGMAVFYKKHLAAQYWAPFNALVYAAIWMRAICFVVVNLIKAKLISLLSTPGTLPKQ